MAKRAILQTSVFLLYLFALFALPGSVLWGAPASALGLIPLLGALIWARLHGYRALKRNLKCRPLSISEAPQLHHFVQEYSRRLGIRAPHVEVCPGSVANSILYGFSEFHLVVTERVLTLPAPALSALAARSLVRLADGWIPSETLLAAILASVDEWIPHSIRGKLSGKRLSARLALCAITLPAFRLLASSTRLEKLDGQGARLCAEPRALSELLRTIEQENTRTPQAVPPSVRHMSLHLPETETALGKIFLQETPLSTRILELERNTRVRSLIVNPA